MRCSLVDNKADDVLKFLKSVDSLNHIMSLSQFSSQSQKCDLAFTLNTRLTMNTTNTKIMKSSGPYSYNFQ